jgi:hypothetical protein
MACKHVSRGCKLARSRIVISQRCSAFLSSIISGAWATSRRYSSWANLLRGEINILLIPQNRNHRAVEIIFPDPVQLWLVKDTSWGSQWCIAYVLNCYSLSSAHGTCLFRLAISVYDAIMTPLYHDSSFLLSSYLHLHSRSSLGGP